jgi:hypothetical protein
MQLEAKISFEADELRSMAEHQAEAKYPAPDGMRWVAIAAYAYASEVIVQLVSDKDEVGEPVTVGEIDVAF